MAALDVVDRAMDLLLAQDMAGFAALWAVDGTMEFPFAPEGYPQRLEGRAAVAEYLRDYTDHVDLRAITSRTARSPATATTGTPWPWPRRSAERRS
jgi:uncharacterized protein